jgi:CBS domain-containing protein
MARDFGPLPAFGVQPAVTFHQPEYSAPEVVRLDDPAAAVMTDFRHVRAITVAPSATMDDAHQRMIANRVHLLLVVDPKNTLLGLVTSTDIEGEKPVRIISERGIKRSEILVGDVMTARDRLEAIDIDAVAHARVGDVVATLKAVGRRHALVVDHDAQGVQRVRGLLAASQLEKQLGGVAIDIPEIARNFAQVEEMLAH